LQKETFIKQPGIQIPILSDLFAGQKPPRSNPIIEIDENNILARVFHYGGTIIVCIRIWDVASALNVDPNGKLRFCCCRSRPPHIDEKAILSLRRGWKLGANSQTDRLKLDIFNGKTGSGEDEIRTAVAFWMPFVVSGSAGALNRKSPRGGAAYRIPRYWFTPEPKVIPWYLEYPRSTAGCPDVLVVDNGEPLTLLTKKVVEAIHAQKEAENISNGMENSCLLFQDRRQRKRRILVYLSSEETRATGTI
jgi:hypothetical protein